MKRNTLGIKSKVLLGSIVIGLILFIAGIISFFEFQRMSQYVSSILTDNMASVNISRNLMNMSEEYNTYILEKIGEQGITEIPDFEGNEDFSISLERIQEHFTIDEEKAMADSVRYAYVAYMHVVQEVPEIWLNGYSVRREWYFNRLQGVYEQLREYIQRLTLVSQNALAENYYSLNDGFYRSIVPIIIAMGVGIVLVILFNYFINIFVLKPILKINLGLKKYKEYNKGYDIRFDYGGDQLQELNTNIKEIIEENRLLKKKK